MRLASDQIRLELPTGRAPLPTLDRRQRGTDFIGMQVTRLANAPESTGMPFWSINPYIGCEFGCSYCYARDTHRWTSERNDIALEKLPAEEFERRIFVKQNAALMLQQTLDPAKVGQSSIAIGTATDPYQPAERRFGVTRSILEAFRGYRGLSIHITTKSPLVARDIDLLRELKQHHRIAVNISLISLDADLIRRLEPKTPLPHARIRALRALSDAGIDAGLMIAPIIPGLTDGWGALGGLMAAAKEAGARYADGSALRLGPVARSGFLPALEREFPKLVDRYRRRYARRHDAGRDYLDALAKRLRTLQRIHGFPENFTYRSTQSRASAGQRGSTTQSLLTLMP
ncbi:MAG: SPL family radical SAM protein [Gemmatimonadales bacterium]